MATVATARWPQLRREPAVVTAGVSFLTGVYCTSRRDCWAVGARLTSTESLVNQILHWNGATWRQVMAPNPGGTGAGHVSDPSAVRCASPRDCWAAGYYSSSNGGPDRNMMLHWTGHKWFATRTPQPAGIGKNAKNELTDVTCVSARNCWAVGLFGKTPGSQLNEVLHWDGTAWSRLRVPEPGGVQNRAQNQLQSVRCPTATRCLAVGFFSTPGSDSAFNQALIWTGRAWARQPVSSPSTGSPPFMAKLLGLGCGGPASCFAVGSASLNGGKSLNQVMRWNGRSWSRSFTPQPGGTGTADENDLFWVTCTSDHNCWAVGSYGSSGQIEFMRNQALHWNGRHWITVHTPNPASGKSDVDFLFSVRCTDGSNCWAVGAQEHKNLADEILHWNGKRWSVWPLAS